MGHLARGTNDVPDDVDPNPRDEPGDPTYKSYFTGDRQLTRFAPKIASYVDAELFVT